MGAFSRRLWLCGLLFLVFFSHCHEVPVKDKWIVITTINKPTAVFDLLVQLSDWQVVVVADIKTPKNWQVPGVIFLSVEDQEKLNYHIVKHLPWRHYGRKNVGYLYAIEHGAKIIYDTDDDNFLYDTINILPEYGNMLRFVDGKVTVNPYAYFGQHTVWPRGYPLRGVKSAQDASLKIVENIFMPIQQGLVDKDPDVDAIFRLTRSNEVFFPEKNAPLILGAHCMAPFNSQNTLFYYSAFWSLLIPCTVTLRVADIWRGYWAQRLLWDIGGGLCFTAASAFQERNEHDLLKDFSDELDLYLKVDQLIAALNEFKSGKKVLSDRMIDMFVMLANAGFIKQGDVDLVCAWIKDLEKVGYLFPPLNNGEEL